MINQSPNLQQIAKRGSNIYRDKYRAAYEREWAGRFAAIDIDTEKAYVADYADQALAKAKAAAPKGVFYLVRIGAASAFKTARRILNAHSGIV